MGPFAGIRLNVRAPNNLNDLSPDVWLRPSRNLGTVGGRLFKAVNKVGLQPGSAIDPGTQDFWLSFWFKPADSTAIQTIFRTGGGSSALNQGGVWVSYEDTSKYHIRLIADDQSTRVDEDLSAAQTDATWHHCVMLFDRDGNASCFINGTDTGITADISAHANALGETDGRFIGQWLAGSSHANGDMSKVLYGEGTLPTAAEITALVGGGNGMTGAQIAIEQPALWAKVTACWNLNEGANATAATDAKGSNSASVVAAELVTNGTFAADTDWTKNTGWTIAAGVASCDGSQVGDSDLEQDIAFASGNTYTVTYTVSNYSAGNIYTRVGTGNGTSRSANGTYVETITAGAGGKLEFRADVNFIGDIDTVTAVSTGPAPCAGPREATASDVTGGNHGTLTNMDTINAWSSDTPDGSYTATLQDSVGSADGTLTGFTDVDTARVDGPDGTWGVHVEDDGSGGYTGVLSPLADSRTSDVHGTSPRDFAFRCDGATSECEFDDEIIGDGAVTICARIKASGWGENNLGRIVDNGKTVLNISTTNDRVIFSSDNGGTSAVSATNSIVLGTEYTVEVTRNADGSLTNIYINGAISGSADQDSGTPAIGSTNMFVGNNSAGSRTFDGIIDDVRIFNSILTAADIALYHAGSDTSATPVFRPRFDERRRLPYLDGCKALRFDGVDDYVTTGYTFDSSAAFTAMAWVRCNIADTDTVFGKGAELQLYLTTGSFRFYGDVGGMLTSGAGEVESDQWVHVAFTTDGTNRTVYVNGIQKGTDANGMGNTAINLALGAYTTPSDFAAGDAIDWCIYSTELSAANILAYVKGTDYTTSLTARWKGDDVARSIASCADGYSLLTDGSSDYVAIGSTEITSSTDWTVTFWQKTDTTVTGNAYLFTGNDFAFGYHSSLDDGVLAWYDGSSWLQEGATRSDNGAWYHFAVSKTGTSYETFLNGASLGTGTCANIDIAAAVLSIACWGAGASDFFDGKTDDLRVYATNLSAADIALLVAGNEPSVSETSRWPFDDGAQGGEPNDGDPVASWEDTVGRKLCNQATAGARPTYAATGINGLPALLFDATIPQYLKYNGLFSTGAEATVFAVVHCSNGNDRSVFSQSVTGAAGHYLSCEIDTDETMNFILDDGGVDELDGDTSLSDDTVYILCWRNNGATLAMQVNNGADEIITETQGANDGKWEGDLTALDITLIGVREDDGGAPFNSYLGDLLTWNRILTVNERTQVYRKLSSWYQ